MSAPPGTIPRTCIADGETYAYGHDVWPQMRYVPAWKACVCKQCDLRDGLVATPEVERRLTAAGVHFNYLPNGCIAVPR